jgi:hypothetical protein
MEAASFGSIHEGLNVFLVRKCVQGSRGQRDRDFRRCGHQVRSGLGLGIFSDGQPSPKNSGGCRSLSHACELRACRSTILKAFSQ